MPALTADDDRDRVLNLSPPYVSAEFSGEPRTIRETPLAIQGQLSWKSVTTEE